MDQHPAQSRVSFETITENPSARRLSVHSKRILHYILIGIGIFVVCNLVLAATYYPDFRMLYDRAQSGKAQLERAQHQLINREFVEAASSLRGARADFDVAAQRIGRIRAWRYLPYIGRQIRAAEQLIVSGQHLTASGERIALLLHDIVEPLKNESISFTSITDEQKLTILRQLRDSRELFVDVQEQIDSAAVALDRIPPNGLIGPLARAVAPLRAYLPAIKTLVDQAVPFIDIGPRLLGMDGQRNYLFLIQNNSELRPTGGFIGTYGILKLKDAEIVEFKTDNIYNLDRPAADILQDPTPWQIRSYLEQKNWGLRDINWDPDFPSTAEKAVWTYTELSRIQHGLQTGARNTPYVPDEIHGVIAVTPEPIQALLAITGPIVTHGILFTEENLKDELEFRLGMEYRELGITEENRKDIIRQLADQMKQRLFALPYHRLFEVADIMVSGLSKKQVQLYSREDDIQEIILERGWGGAIDRALDNDYLLVVDTNFGSLKTDPFIDRFIDYSFVWQGSDLVATAKITYKNRANFTWKTTRLRNYMRLYVPAGSELLSATGAMEQDKVRDPQRRPGKVDIVNQHDKAVFGAFVSIEPGEEETLTFTYRLPRRIADQVRRGSYQLRAQKQAGAYPYLTLRLDFGKPITSAKPPEEERNWFDSVYTYSVQLMQDSYFTITLR